MKNYLPFLHFFKAFPLLLNSGELERLILKHIGKAHKPEHISELHASQINIFPCKFRIIYQTTLFHATESNKFMSEKRTYNSEILTIHFLI